MKKIMLLIIISLMISCRFQPNNADGIIVQKISDDTLILNIIDSYHIIDKYEKRKEKDTLFIEILSLSSPNSNDDLLPPVIIPIGSGIKFIKIQNDRMYVLDSISKFRGNVFNVGNTSD